MSFLKITSIDTKPSNALKADGTPANRAWVMLSRPSVSLTLDPETGEQVQVYGRPVTAGTSIMLEDYTSKSGKDMKAHHLAGRKVGDRVQGFIERVGEADGLSPYTNKDGSTTYTTTNLVFLQETEPTDEQVEAAVEAFNAEQVALNRVAVLVP